MKVNLRVLLLVFATCVFVMILSEISAKASDRNCDNKEVDIAELMQSKFVQITEEDVVELIKERFDYESENETSYFVTEDAPADIKNLIDLRSSDYTVRPYSLTTTFQKTNFWGNKVDFITIVVYGETYIYTDGKVHIFSMGVSATVYESGWSVSIDTPNIVNTDGTISIGISFVYCTRLDAIHGFGCFVSITRGDTRPEVEVTEVQY